MRRHVKFPLCECQWRYFSTIASIIKLCSSYKVKQQVGCIACYLYGKTTKINILIANNKTYMENESLRKVVDGWKLGNENTHLKILEEHTHNYRREKHKILWVDQVKSSMYAVIFDITGLHLALNTAEWL